MADMAQVYLKLTGTAASTSIILTGLVSKGALKEMMSGPYLRTRIIPSGLVPVMDCMPAGPLAEDLIFIRSGLPAMPTPIHMLSAICWRTGREIYGSALTGRGCFISIRRKVLFIPVPAAPGVPLRMWPIHVFRCLWTGWALSGLAATV